MHNNTSIIDNYTYYEHFVKQKSSINLNVTIKANREPLFFKSVERTSQ